MPVFYGKTISSPMMLGTAQYPSPAILAAAFEANPARWSVKSLSERNILVSSGVNPTLGNMIK